MIELIDVSKHYQTKQGLVKAIDQLSLKIHPQEVFGIVGESGAGKSTLLRFINLLEKPSQGKVIVDGIQIQGLTENQLRLQRKSIGMIFQHFNLLNNRTVEDNILLPLRMHSYTEALDIERVLNFVGLEKQRFQYPSELSGGQKQRVGIARALIMKPKILLCDEPTSALDATMKTEIINLLYKAHQAFDMTIILVTHELDVVQQLCHRVAIIDQGRLVNIIENQPVLNPQDQLSYPERVLEVLSHES